MTTSFSTNMPLLISRRKKFYWMTAIPLKTDFTKHIIHSVVSEILFFKKFKILKKRYRKEKKNISRIFQYRFKWHSSQMLLNQSGSIPLSIFRCDQKLRIKNQCLNPVFFKQLLFRLIKKIWAQKLQQYCNNWYVLIATFVDFFKQQDLSNTTIIIITVVRKSN